MDEPGHVTDLIVEEAVEWIRSAEEPWFCYVPFSAVHIPIKAPQKWLDEYADRHFSDDPAVNEGYKRYYAYASQMDFGIGCLVEELDRLCLRDRTLIIFSSDNGAMPNRPPQSVFLYPGYQDAAPIPGCNLPWRGHKGQLYEGGIRTPTVVNCPGCIRSGVMSAPVHISDWMPTFSGLLGCPPAADPQWDGIDIWPLITSSSEGQDHSHAACDDRAIYWNLKESEFAIRKGEWKLISRPEGGAPATELFNLREDPSEERNVFAEQTEIADELLSRIKRERTRDGASKRPEVDDPKVVDEESEP